MEYAQHESYLNAVVTDSKGNVLGTNRDHYEVAAKSGNPRAIAALYATPEIPETVLYLWDWARELHGKSGVGMSGYNPLTYTTIADWARLTGNDPEPHEVEVLFWLDAILLNPPKDAPTSG